MRNFNIPLIHQMFEAQSTRSSSAIAVEFHNQSLTYKALNDRANQLAHYLQHQGVKPDTPIALCVDRCFELIISVLAILKAGGAYLPLDPTYPTERLCFMLENAQAPLLLTQSHLLPHLPVDAVQTICLDTEAEKIAQCCVVNPDSDVEAEHLAYVIYTSGSTGQPKAVAMPHRPLVNLIHWQQHNSSVVAEARTLQFTPISFDVSFQEIFATLTTGGTLVLIDDETRRDLKNLPKFLNEAAIERLFLPFVALQHLAESAQFTETTPKHLREVITAGEQLRITVAIANWFRQMPACTLHNHYGPSETHVVTAYTLTGSPGQWELLPPIGRAIDNVEIYLLDEQLQPVSEGELYIGGACLAREYLNRPDLTQERFIANPLPGCLTEQLYKTGDLACYLPDGSLKFLGRIDQQVKIRGFRVELGEIEAALEQHPAVREAVAIVRGDDVQRLVAYAIADETALADDDFAEVPRLLRQFLKTQLPDYMRPNEIVIVEEFPMTPSGKLDRRRLPIPDYNSHQSNLILPRSTTEATLAQIWAQVLSFQQIGIDDDFLELGGHSLLATQIISRIRSAFGVELSLRCLFEAPTVRQLAKEITAIQQTNQNELLSQIQVVPQEGELPLSYVQEPLWFLDQLVPNHPFYNVPEAFRLEGALNVRALEQSFQKIVNRHEALRTNFAVANGKPVQVIRSSAQFKLAVVDVISQATETFVLPITQQDTELGKLILNESRRPFDLSKDILLRATLFRLSDNEHILFVNLHHIICDGWSIEILLEELSTLYHGYASNQTVILPNLAIQYADFTVWNRQYLQDDIRDRQLKYWKHQLADLPPILQLPTDYPRPSVSSYQGARHFFSLSNMIVQKLKQLSHCEGVTLFMTLLGAFQTLLFQYSGQDDIAIGSLLANRHHPEIETLLGFFSNTIVLRSDMSGLPTFRQLIKRVRETTLEAYAHRDLSLDLIVRALQPNRDLNQNPLVQVVFNFQNKQTSTWEFPSIGLTHLPLDNQTAKFDLFLELIETPTDLSGYFEYSTDLFKADTISRLAEHFQILLETVVANPEVRLSDICLLTPTEQQFQHQALDKSNKDVLLQRVRQSKDFTSPLTSTEEQLAVIWGQVLGIERVSIHDDFFNLGGHSLLAVRVLEQIQSTFHIEFSLRNLFLAPTIYQLAKIIEAQRTEFTQLTNIYPTLDLYAEIALDPSISVDGDVVTVVNYPTNVLITGASGFFGAFLLYELLQQTQANVYCLIRASSEEAGRKRLQQNLEQYSLWQPSQATRIVPIIGDLSLPRLGLSDALFQTLSATIDTIYHNGGLVNFIYPYSVLKAANVLGTEEILRLAGQTRTKPVHFISTVGVFSPIGYTHGQIIRAEDKPVHLEGLYGYTQSKWVAEQLINLAQARGVPATIYRPAWIEGHSQTGACNQSDFLRGLIQGCIHMGIAPDWNMPIDILPVDYISRAIVHLSSKTTSLGNAFNFSNPRSLMWTQLVEWMIEFGYSVQILPYQQWLNAANGQVENNSGHPLYPFLSFLTEKLPDYHMSVPEIYFQTNSIYFDTQNIIEGLSDIDLSCPSLDEKLLATYFSYFIRSGFLPVPSDR